MYHYKAEVVEVRMDDGRVDLLIDVGFGITDEHILELYGVKLGKDAPEFLRVLLAKFDNKVEVETVREKVGDEEKLGCILWVHLDEQMAKRTYRIKDGEERQFLYSPNMVVRAGRGNFLHVNSWLVECEYAEVDYESREATANA